MSAASEDIPSGEQIPQANKQVPKSPATQANAATQDPRGAQKRGKGSSQDAPKEAKDASDGKLSAKELKEKAKAEKAARRAREKQSGQGQPVMELKGGNDAKANAQKKAQGLEPTANPQAKIHRRKSSAGANNAQKTLPLRPAAPEVASKAQEPKQDDKRVELFRHLYGQPRRHTIAGASRDVHPSVLALGLQMSSYEILGSNSRCVTTLLVLKEVIAAYTTPIGTSLPRHLTTSLATQIDYLVSCRPLSVSQGNAIRWLKVKISALDVSMPEDQAKQELCEAIDNFIRDRIVVADEVIAASASQRIKDSDVVMTYGKSTIVEKTLVEAHKRNKRLKVIVVDSNPLFEGRYLTQNLLEHGIDVEYSLVRGLSHVAPTATKCLLGAHAMLGNGRLYSRVGTAMVAMMAKDSNLPVMVCCESVKLTEKAVLDSFAMNEIAPGDELVPPKFSASGSESALLEWRDVPNLHLLNIMYDLTPPELIDVVITEHGNMPPQSVIAVQRLSTNVT